VGDNYLVISSDGHAGPPPEQYAQYMDPVHRARYEEFIATLVAMREAGNGAFSAQTKFRDKFLAKTGDGGIRASWDSDVRLKELDADGIAAEVLFPDADVLGIGGISSSPFGTGLGASGRDDPELAMAGARAHNRWLADLCAQAPERRAGVMTVPIIHDPKAGVEEIRRAFDDGVTGAVMIPTQWAPHASYNDAVYDEVWATCQERNLCVTVHAGGTPGDVSGTNALPVFSAEAWFFAARPLWSLIWGGVFERFPDLKFAVTEDGGWWKPGMFTQMDMQWEGLHTTLKFGDTYRLALPEKPSFYFDRNCFIAIGITDLEMGMRDEIGVDQLIWGHDFPHPEGFWPHTRDWQRIRFHDVPENETRKMLGLNALRAFKNLDADKLRAIADDIGPTPDEIHHQPPPPNPDEVAA